MVKVRIGLGRSSSGKILDRDTRWYNLSQDGAKELAIIDACESKKPIFVSYNNRKYQEITLAQLKKL